MLRITAINTSDKILLRLEGRLVGPWVEELRKTVWQTNAWRGTLEIDVTDLTFADEEGEQTLLWLGRMGARFRGNNLLLQHLLDLSGTTPQ